MEIQSNGFRQLIQTLLASLLMLVYTACVTPNAKPVAEVTQNQNSVVALGNQYARDGLLREAVDAYKRALQKEPDNQIAHRNLGIVLVKAGDFTNAIIHLEKYIATNSDNFDANFYLGEAYRATDKYAEAIFRYKSALKIQNDEPRSMKSLAWSYYKTRFYTEALSVSKKMLINHQNDEQIPIIIARVYLKLRRESDALNVLRKFSSQVPASSMPYFQSVEAEILHSKGQTLNALNLYKAALKSQPMLAGALLGTGRILLEQGKYVDAVDYLERAVRVKPRLYEGHYFLGKALEKTNPSRAVRYFAYFRKNAAADPEFIDLVQDATQRIVALNNSKTKIDVIGN